jgi:SAM-dependent methyltransferase
MTDPTSFADKIPPISPIVMPGSYRWNVIDALEGSANVGIELGVAGGSFSQRMVASGKFAQFWGVDSYEGAHSTAEYKAALRHIGLTQRYRLLRMRFAEAVDLFDAHFFDFIYVDGFAHTGEEGGRTMLDWYAKLRPGGIMAGDDYSRQKWPLVVWGVHHMVAQLGVPLFVTDKVLDETYNKFPSWFFVKPSDTAEPPLTPDPELVRIGEVARAEREAADRETRRLRRLARQAAGGASAP